MAKKLDETKHPVPVYVHGTGQILGVLLDGRGRPMMLSEADLHGEVIPDESTKEAGDYDDDEIPF